MGKYYIRFTDVSKDPIEVDEHGIDDTTLDVALFGRVRTEYGERLNQNLLNLMENFAVGSDPNVLPPTPTPMPSQSATPAPSASPAPAPEVSATPTPTPSNTPLPTPTPTPSSFPPVTIATTPSSEIHQGGYCSVTDVYTQTVTTTVTGGSGSFIYQWQCVSGDCVAVLPTLATNKDTPFSGHGLGTNSAVYRLRATDTITGIQSYSNNITVTITCVDDIPPPVTPGGPTGSWAWVEWDGSPGGCYSVNGTATVPCVAIPTQPPPIGSCYIGDVSGAETSECDNGDGTFTRCGGYYICQ